MAYDSLREIQPADTKSLGVSSSAQARACDVRTLVLPMAEVAADGGPSGNDSEEVAGQLA
ncbi:hypothetical protein GCM10010169_20300 [Micromonospora fulviviridis]|nr:hypothetical protein GCM10010169_20300 [Micromonospora fulviviridis]